MPLIPQTLTIFSPSIIHAACAFDILASFREFVQGKPWRAHEFAAAWHGAVDRGLISGDLNGDGDMDDPGEAVIQDWQKLVNFLGLPLEYLGKFDLVDYPKFDTSAFWVLTAWKWKITHWVSGIRAPVFWDSIAGGSQTVANGAPQPLGRDGSGGLRVFRVKLQS
jgi:hypothetical protein